MVCAARLMLGGWRILERKLVRGRGTGAGEIDIIARRGDIVAFIEVKARADEDTAAASLLGQQRQRIIRAAEAFLQRHPDLSQCQLRFDVMVLGRGLWPKHLADAWRP